MSMASSQVGAVEDKHVKLNYLGFVRVLTLNAVVLVSSVYDYAKQYSGSLKPKVESMEKSVRSVWRPVYERFGGVPDNTLVFLDRKVGEAAVKFDEYAPPTAKKLAHKAKLILIRASKITQDVADEAKVSGPLAAISRARTISKRIAVTQLAFVWSKLNKYPALRGFPEMALHLSEKYNKLVIDMAGKGYGVFTYVPLVPIEEINRAYKQTEKGASKKMDDKGESSSDSNKE